MRTHLTAVILLLGALLGLASPVAAQGGRFDLDTLHVTVGSRTLGTVPAAARSVEVLDRHDIERIPARSLNDVLAWALGADLLARSPAQADIALRGSSFEQVVIMVDGVPVSDDQTGHFDLDLAVALAAVERIEILRGPSSAVYGPDAVGGTINIVTGDDAAAPTGRAEAGSFGATALDLAAGTRIGDVSLTGSGGWDRSDGHRDGTDFRTLTGRLALASPLAGGRLSAAAGFAARDFGAADFYGPYTSYEETRTLTADATWQSDRRTGFTIQPAVRFRSHDDDFILLRDDPGVYRNIHHNWRAGAEMVARYSSSRGPTLAAGASAERMRLDSERLGDRTESRTAVFTEITVGDPAGSVATAGLRLDHHSAYGSFVSPSVAAATRLSDHVRVRASVDRGLRAPTWTERFYMDPANIGNPDLEEERFWAAELGLTAVAASSLSLDIATFIRRAENLIDWARPAGADESEVWVTTNIENATFRGIEITAAARRLLGADWSLRASAIDFVDDESDGFTSKYALRPITRSVSLHASFAITTDLALTARALDARRHGDDAFQSFDTRLAWSRGRTTVYFDATNIGDSRPLDVAGQPSAGRAFAIGLRLGGPAGR